MKAKGPAVGKGGRRSEVDRSLVVVQLSLGIWDDYRHSLVLKLLPVVAWNYVCRKLRWSVGSAREPVKRVVELISHSDHSVLQVNWSSWKVSLLWKKKKAACAVLDVSYVKLRQSDAKAVILDRRASVLPRTHRSRSTSRRRVAVALSVHRWIGRVRISASFEYTRRKKKTMVQQGGLLGKGQAERFLGGDSP